MDNSSIPLPVFDPPTCYREIVALNRRLAPSCYRWCSGCAEAVPYDRFYLNPRFGFSSRCRKCVNSTVDPLRKAEGQRARHLQRTYGLAPGDFERLVAAQGGVCGLCGCPPRGKGHTAILHVDHCHETGKVRGLLCSRCNVALASLGDTPEALRRVLAYVERGKA